jgi:hypothetical protein
MSYRIDLINPTVLVPCTYVASANPGKTLSVNEDGSSVCVEPDGSQTRMIPAGDPNWDSSYTQGIVMSGFLVYRSVTPTLPGVPRGYKMVV